ncbi:MAG: SRPBCC domain-containing protein [Nocardioides sp.]|nr:SRPBCC domain-containing protein [Nocardioides sp.]
MGGQSERLVLRLSCVLHAPDETVFRALTDPGLLAKWWGPSGFTTPGIDLDLRVGGRYRFGMQPPVGDLFHLTGEFLEVRPPRRLVYTFRWEEPDPDDRETVVELAVSPVGDGAELSLSQGDFATPARLELHRSGLARQLREASRTR